MSFRNKTIFGIASIEATLLLFMIWTSLSDLTRSNEQALKDRASTTATLFATTTTNAVLGTDLASLESYISELLKNQGLIYARVIDAEGLVLAEGGDEYALSTAFVQDRALSSITDERFDTRSIIEEGGVTYGYVELGISIRHIQHIYSQARQRLITIAAIELLLVAIFSLFLGIYLTRQLKQLQRAAERIADGDLNCNVEIKSSDELGMLAKTFNSMSEKLTDANTARDEYDQKLEAVNIELEDRVSRRTQSLQVANQSLTETNNRLQDAQIQLVQSEKLASLGQLAAGVAHEINNPLSFVNSNLSSLNDYVDDLRVLVDGYIKYESKLPEDCRQDISRIKNDIDYKFICDDLKNLLEESIEGSDRVRKIVLDLKNYSRVDSADWQQVDIHDCINSTLNVAKNEIKYRANVQTDFGDIVEVYCVASEINQVLMNLFVNGAQSMEAFGLLKISTGCEADEVWISIEDNGSGIEEKTLSKIFDPFFTTKKVGEGTGLGLAISNRIVSRHQGRIEVNSKIGQGTQFRVWLPVNQTRQQTDYAAPEALDCG